MRRHYKILIAAGSLVITILFAVLITRILNAIKVKRLAKTDSNVIAFLAMIRHSEGTAGPNGYKTLYGGGLFSGSQHPNTRVCAGGYCSTAAGAYQFLYSTWKGVKSALSLPDFSPESQDAGAVELIRRRGGLDYVIAGRFAEAVHAVRKEWASLPGAGYGQGEHSLSVVTNWYLEAGGQVV